jgi:electron transport complex protein RnfG
MFDIIRLTLVLTTIALLAAIALAVTNSHTAPLIRKRHLQVQTEALREVLGPGVSIEAKHGINPLPATYWIARKNGVITGFAFMDSARGYVQEIKAIVGVDSAGNFSGLKVIEQNETPGMGSRIGESSETRYLWHTANRRSKDPGPWFSRQFTGLNATRRINLGKSKEWRLLSDSEKKALAGRNEVTAITGATISTRAVLKSVNQSIPRYVEYLKTAGVAQ